MKILLLEDDTILADTLEELLKEHNLSVKTVHTGGDAVDEVFDNKYDMYIFDINLPDYNGIDLLRSLKDTEDTTPTIFISANVDISTIAKGFDAGAFDYLKKPFLPEELLIRVNARLVEKHIIRYKHIQFNTLSQDIFIDGKKVYLSYSQFKLFEVLFKNIGQVIAKDELFEYLEGGNDSALRVAMNKLRGTINVDIKNVRGVGYTIEPC
ncbi:response regulator transcription factor [Sulfurimonas sp.]|uniref:response regulator transcription factor n=1 Tax=Sulfurimonas sp. TaxID=2022749 RepID=UPI003D11408B